MSLKILSKIILREARREWIEINIIQSIGDELALAKRLKSEGLTVASVKLPNGQKI